MGGGGGGPRADAGSDAAWSDAGGREGGAGAPNVGGTAGGDAAMAAGGGPLDGGLGVVPAFSWRTLPSLTIKRQNAMAVAVSGAMYVMGGVGENGAVADVERLDPAQTGWTVAPSLPNPQCCAAAGLLGSVIAVAGGYESDGFTPTNALLLFDTVTGVWKSGPPMPTARAAPMGAVWRGKLAVIGGGTQYGGTQLTGVIELYDPSSDSWETSTLAVTPRSGGVALADGDRIYVVGGGVDKSLYGDSLVEVIAADGVTAAPPLGVARAQVTGGVLPTGLVVAGGWTAQLDTPMVEGLFGAKVGWQPLPPMPTSRAGAAAAVVNGVLIVAGGGQFQHVTWNRQNVVEALEPTQPPADGGMSADGSVQ